MSLYMKNRKNFACTVAKDDFIAVGENAVRDGVGIIMSENDDECNVCLSWDKARELRDHLTALLENPDRRLEKCT